LENLKARSIEPAPAGENSWPGLIINYEQVMTRKGRPATLSIAIYKTDASIYTLVFMTCHLQKESEPHVPHVVHHMNQLDGLSDLLPAIMIGTLISKRTELRPDLPPIEIIEI